SRSTAAARSAGRNSAASLPLQPGREKGSVPPPKTLITPTLFSQPPPHPPGEEGEKQNGSNRVPLSRSGGVRWEGGEGGGIGRGRAGEGPARSRPPRRRNARGAARDRSGGGCGRRACAPARRGWRAPPVAGRGRSPGGRAAAAPSCPPVPAGGADP